MEACSEPGGYVANQEGMPLLYDGLADIFRMLTMRESDKRIEQQLRSEKPMREAPHGFTERVMAELSRVPEDSAAEREREQSLSFWPRFALALASIAIVAVFAVEFSRPKSQPFVSSSDQPEIVEPSAHSKAQIASADLALPVITPEQIQALTVKLDDPLKKELNNVISDTRQAIQFVALNFLPEK